MLMLTLTALVQRVEPGNVIATHLLSIAKGHVRVRDGEHGGLVVLGEGVPTAGSPAVRLKHCTSCTHNSHRPEVKLLVLTCGTA